MEILQMLQSVDLIQFLVNAAGDAEGFCEATKDIWKLVGQVIRIILIVIPVILVLLGTFDLGKAVMAGDDKEIKEAQKMFVKRLIYGVVIFFIPYIIAGVFSLFNGLSSKEAQQQGKTNATDSSTCWRCAIKPNSCN